MSDTPIHTGWTSIDDGSDVPVRSSSPKKNGAHDSIVIGSHVTETREKRTTGATHTVTEINPHMMQMSAVTGIGIVLIGAAFYFGVLNLRGSVTDTGMTTGVTVTITEQNTFDPVSVSVPDGGSITFVNKNQNPQVLKSENPSRSLFPVQVVFKDPVTVTINAGDGQPYTYVSETMPNDQTLTIDVTQKQTPVPPAVESTPAEQATPIDTTTSLAIPLPFGDTAVMPSETTPPEISVTPTLDTPATTPVFVQSDHGSESAVISLGHTNEPVAEPAFTDASIAINPYTVEAGKKNKSASASIALTNKKKQTLHSGAPLEALRAHKPYQTANTGPENLWALLILASMGLGIAYARTLKKV